MHGANDCQRLPLGAPHKVLEARIGQGRARDEAFGEALPNYCTQAVKEHEGGSARSAVISSEMIACVGDTELTSRSPREDQCEA